MKTYSYGDVLVSIIKDLGVKDKYGTWVQVEFVSGDDKGCRKPVTLEQLNGGASVHIDV